MIPSEKIYVRLTSHAYKRIKLRLKVYNNRNNEQVNSTYIKKLLIKSAKELPEKIKDSVTIEVADLIITYYVSELKYEEMINCYSRVIITVSVIKKKDDVDDFIVFINEENFEKFFNKLVLYNSEFKNKEREIKRAIIEEVQSIEEDVLDEPTYRSVWILGTKIEFMCIERYVAMNETDPHLERQVFSLHVKSKVNHTKRKNGVVNNESISYRNKQYKRMKRATIQADYEDEEYDYHDYKFRN